MSNSRKPGLHSILVGSCVGVLLALCSASTSAQCAMCRASIGSNSLFARNLNIGVLVLLVPPVAIFCTIFVLAYRYRRSA
jgi:hypothetical protein